LLPVECDQVFLSIGLPECWAFDCSHPLRCTRVQLWTPGSAVLPARWISPRAGAGRSRGSS